MNTLFSVIIPVYNVAPYLRECLDSVVAQICPSWEAICIDDGSTDGSGAILDEYGAKDSRIQVIHRENAGVSAARNVGLVRACGQWVLFLDSDDVLAPNTLLACRTVINNVATVDLVTYAVRRVPDGVKWCLDAGNAVWEFKDLSKWLDGDIIETEVWCACYRSEVVQGLQFDPNLMIGEDRVFFGEVLARCRAAVSIKNACYGYRLRTSSTIRSRKTAKHVHDAMICWIRRSAMLLSDTRSFDRRRLRQYLQLGTEVFARQYYALPKSEREGLFATWIEALDVLRNLQTRMPRWYAFTIWLSTTLRSEWVLWCCCYLLDRLKLLGLHR